MQSVIPDNRLLEVRISGKKELNFASGHKHGFCY